MGAECKYGCEERLFHLKEWCEEQVERRGRWLEERLGEGGWNATDDPHLAALLGERRAYRMVAEDLDRWAAIERCPCGCAIPMGSEHYAECHGCQDCVTGPAPCSGCGHNTEDLRLIDNKALCPNCAELHGDRA